MNAWQFSEPPLTTPQTAIDSYRFPGVRDFDQPEIVGAVDELGDYFLPAPDPRQRLPFTLAAEDSHRLDLHAVLTTAGIAPLPGDMDAINVLSALDDTTVSAVLRWVGSAPR
ncbi:hypothetical protein ACH492_32465 [Streptomyces sp. NPDC019443]|uniref:hypothetical protein n=1 Tax=Streptomyces sp. NPDC019443 TaxID=3365061 RepID=UPI0037A3AD79